MTSSNCRRPEPARYNQDLCLSFRLLHVYYCRQTPPSSPSVVLTASLPVAVVWFPILPVQLLPRPPGRGHSSKSCYPAPLVLLVDLVRDCFEPPLLLLANQFLLFQLEQELPFPDAECVAAEQILDQLGIRRTASSS